MKFGRSQNTTGHLFARIGAMRVFDRHAERIFDPLRKDKHWGRRKLARDR